jgi:outer membrane protein assembly factor BamB
MRISLILYFERSYNSTERHIYSKLNVARWRRMKHGVYTLVLSTLLLVAVAGDIVEHTDNWISYKGSEERRGSSDAPAPGTCYLLWKVDTQSELYASPVVRDGKVFQVAQDLLYCIDLDTGEILWTSHVPVYQSTPFLANDKIIVATNRGILALSIETGEILWEYTISGRFRKEYPLEDYIISSPVVSHGKVVVGTMSSYYVGEEDNLGVPDEMFLVCVDENTGEEQWYIEPNLGVRTSPCVADSRVVAASREMMCINLETGEIVWKSEDTYPWSYNKSVKERYAFDKSTPALFHGILITGSSDLQIAPGGSRYIEWQKTVFMDQYTGDILWEWVGEGVLGSSPAIYRDRVFIYSLDGMVRCISFLEGEELWKTSISEPRQFQVPGFKLWPSPTVADGKVYIGSIEGVVYCLECTTGEILWKYEAQGEIRSAPAVVDGKVLVSSTDGFLYCFGIDPSTYRMKAEQYIGEGNIEKAKDFLLKAKEQAGSEESQGIDTLLETIDREMPEYTKIQKKKIEAESLMDAADEFLWESNFEEARNSYVKALEIYKEAGDDFLTAFCTQRIDYIEKWTPYGKIAFDSSRETGEEIYITDMRGIGVRRLTNNYVDDQSPAWSPDGMTLAFTRRDGIYTVDLYGRTLKKLTYSGVNPAWSPDGKRIAFSTNRDGNYEIYVMNADGTDQVNISENTADDTYPAWSPDGKRIAFSTNRDGNYEIYVMNADGTDQVNISENTADDTCPAWCCLSCPSEKSFLASYSVFLVAAIVIIIILILSKRYS